MPLDIENEGRFLASKLDQSRTNEVTSRLQQDSQYLDQRGYSELLRTINRYDQKGVGDDLIIVNNQNGPVFREAPPPPAYYPPGAPPRAYESYPPPPPRPNHADCTILSAGAGAILGNILSPNGRRGVGTAAGAITGAVVGNEACNR